VIFTTILAIILFPLYSYKVLFLFILGVLIDIDHYFEYAISKKDFNPWKAYQFYMENERKKIKRERKVHIFHLIEFWILILIITIYLKTDYMFLISAGLILHLSLDFYDAIKNKKHGRYNSIIQKLTAGPSSSTNLKA